MYLNYISFFIQFWNEDYISTVPFEIILFCKYSKPRGFVNLINLRRVYELPDRRVSRGFEKSRREQGNINMFEGMRELLKRRLVSLTGF